VDPLLAASGTGCSVFTTQTSCESYGVRSLCTFVDGKCIDKPIVAWQACCDCGGGILTPETLPPTQAPTTSPSSPTFSPTSAPVPVEDQVLGISGLVSLDTSPVSSNKVKLYMYRLTYFTNNEMKDAIEKAFYEPLPAPIGEYPKFNATLGKFDSIPNAVVNTPTVPNYGNFEFATEPVEGLPGVYYLFLMYSCKGVGKKYPLYTDRINIPGVSFSNNPIIYFTEIRMDGTPILSIFDCVNFNFDCFGSFKETDEYTLTVPPKYTNGTEGSFNQCSFNLFLEKESIERKLFFSFLLFMFLERNGVASVDNKENASKICPTYYADCVSDADCLAQLESVLPNINIGMQAGIDWGNDPSKSELESTIGAVDITKFQYLDFCVKYKYYNNISKVIENKNNFFTVKSDQTCDFMKTYYKHCKVTTSDNDNQMMQTMTQDQYDKYVLTTLLLENYVEPFCLLQREGLKLDFDLSSFIKYTVDNGINILGDNTIPPEIADIFYDLNAFEQIQKQCVS
jgi:hypothetical protein